MTSLRAQNLVKRYAISNASRRDVLRGEILRTWFGLRLGNKQVRYREAVRGVSFEVTKGESLAFIGRNGAGKSTVLKLIMGVLTADDGRLEVSGAVGGLIELGAGLDGSKSGEENVIDRAGLLGIDDDRVRDFLVSIEEFAELGEQFYDPVGTYSSGMKARLGFAIAVMLPFDIMICDEALSVGDAKFAAKCLAKVNELKQDRIFLFVSHSMAMVQRFCDRGIVLDKGVAVFSGEVTEAVAYYEDNVLNRSEDAPQIEDFVQADESRAAPVASRSFLEPLLFNTEKVTEWHAEVAVDDGIEIDWSVSLTGVRSGPDVQYRLGFPVFGGDGTMQFGCAHENVRQTNAETITGKLVVPRHGLHPGVYYIVISLFEGMEPILRQLVKEVRILSTGLPYFGAYSVDHSWVIRNGEDAQDG